LWDSWHEPVTVDLRKIAETVARTLLITAQNTGLTLSRKLEQTLRSRDDDEDESRKLRLPVSVYTTVVMPTVV